MLTASQLEALRQVDIATIDKNELVDIRTVQVDKDAPFEERLQQFMEQIKNPYAFRVGDVAVKLEFAENGKTLREAIVSYLTMIRQ